MNKVNFLGINVSVINIPQLVQHVICSVKEGYGLQQLNYMNVHTCYLCFHDREFRSVLNNSEIVFCDGFGVKLGARLLGIHLGERMTPPDWIDTLFAACVDQNISMFFLGDEDEVVRLFAKKVQDKFPTLKIAGYHDGFFKQEGTGNKKIIEQINQSGAQVLITGMGAPLQEKWAFYNKEQIGTKVVIGTGALFRWYTKVEQRGPRFVTDNGFEWLWRLFVQPRKVWKRYLVELPYFFWVVIKQYFKKKE